MRGSVLRFIKTYQHLQLLLTLSAGLFIAACSPSSSVVSSVDSLNQRIATTLQIEPATLSYTPRPASMPSVRQLKPVTSSAGMGLLTSLRLGHCRAGQLIAERNSSLGRLEDGLMRFQDDIALLQALVVCAEMPQSDLIVDELNQAIADKRQKLAVDKAYAIATDKALRNALTVAAQPLQRIDDSAFNPVLTALKKLTNWLQQPQTNSNLSVWLETLAQSDYLPRLMRSVIAMRLNLIQLQRQLPPLTAAAGCNAKVVPERAEILRNVFMRFFINEVQVNLAQLTTQYQQLQPVLASLAEQVPQPSLKRYLRQLSEQGQRLAQASKRFVQPWQQLFADCGFTPGAS